MKKIALVIVFAVALVLLLTLCNHSTATSNETKPYAVYLPLLMRAEEQQKMDGLMFSPYPDELEWFETPSDNIVSARLEAVKGFTDWVRIYGCDPDRLRWVTMAKAAGLKVAITADLRSGSGTWNPNQVQCLISSVALGADRLVLGEETVSQGYLLTGQVRTYLNQIRGSVPSTVLIGYADRYDFWKDNLFQDVDFIILKEEPATVGVSVTEAIARVQAHYATIDGFSSQEIWLETWWPSCDSFDQAVGSIENVELYLGAMRQFADQGDFPLFWPAFDEAWRVGAYGRPIYGCQGLWDSQAIPKPVDFFVK